MWRATGSLVMALALVVAGCRQEGSTTPQPAPSSSSRTTTLADWPTYHHDPARTGVVAAGPTGALEVGWKANLDGPVYGEPLVVGNLLLVATERNQVYGLDARTGEVRWRRGLGTPQPLSGLPCGNIDPLGVTGTPAYDAATKTLFVAAETDGGHHTLWALDPRDGSTRWRRNLDTQPGRNIKAEQQRGALLVSHGRVITVFGGLFGDCGNYVGYATSVPVDGHGTTTSYAVPTARRAGIWATPGAVDGPGGTVLVASGNGADLGGAWDGSDSVVALDPVSMRPQSVFAPSSWPQDNQRDLDLGSMSPAYVAKSHRVVIAGKSGEVYLLATPFGGVGSQVATTHGCHSYGGSAVDGSVVLLPCLGERAVKQLTVGADSLSWGWTAEGVYGSPVIAGDKVYVADRGSGDLVVLALATGQEIARTACGPLPHFPSEVVAGDWVFVPTLDGVTAFRGT